MMDTLLGLAAAKVDPPSLMAYEPGSFAKLTIDQRLPKILRAAAQSTGHADDPRWDELHHAIASGGPIDTRLLAPISPYWAAVPRMLENRRWLELPFFGLEFLFYHCLNTIAAAIDPALDVFVKDRRSALEAGLARLEEANTPFPAELGAALQFSLLGNEFDLSQLSPTANMSGTMVVDEREDLIAQLECAKGSVVILADNAGLELIADLILADRLIRDDGALVALHVKPWPMFVSDALVSDVDLTIAALRQQGGDLSAAGGRLDDARRLGRLIVEAPLEWGEPRHFGDLPAGLRSTLEAQSVVIAKGDLNYRRIIGDRDWPASTPCSLASQAGPINLFALRMAKSEVAVGLSPDREAALHREADSWRISGRYGMIQKMG